MKLILLVIGLSLCGCSMRDKYGIPNNVTEAQAKEILADIARDMQAWKETDQNKLEGTQK